MKVVVLGAVGMLGHKVVQTLARRFPGDVAGTIWEKKDDVPFLRDDPPGGARILEGLDATDYRAFESALERLEPEVVVNCIGIVKQRREAHDAVVSISLNALLPHELARSCHAWGARLIHVSTDCVFSGRKGRYTEEDPSDAEDLYGQTKALGEVSEANALTLRTSIIGRELEHFASLLEWFLAQTAGPVRGFTRALYSGVTTNHLAGLMGDIIAEHPGLTGLYQVVGPTISKYDLLRSIRDAYGRKVEILPDDSLVCDRSMRGDKLRAATGYVAPTWPELLEELAHDPTPYERWR